MWTAFPSSDYYADSATPCAHRPASGLAGPPPAARRARGASHVHHDPFDRVGSWLYPYSASGGHSQHPVGHHARVKEPGAERAAVKQGGVVAVHDPDPPGFGSLQDSRGFYHHFAFALPFGLASTHAGVWQYRPAVALSGRLTSDARSRALAVPSFSEPLHQPRTGIPTGTDETFDIRHLLSHGASWRRFTFCGYTFRPRKAYNQRTGEVFTGFLPAVSPEKLTMMSRRVASWRLHRRTTLDLNDLAAGINLVLRGWLSYFTAFYPTAVIHSASASTTIWSAGRGGNTNDWHAVPRGHGHGYRASEPGTLGLFVHWRYCGAAPSGQTARAV